MCVSQQVRVSQTRLATMSTEHVDVAGSVSAPESWSRSYQQPMRARLPRLLTDSARIDLNLHWSALEHLVSCMPPPADADADADADVAMANAVNENLANERLEAAGVDLTRRFVCVDGHPTWNLPSKSPSAFMKLIKKLAK